MWSLRRSAGTFDGSRGATEGALEPARPIGPTDDLDRGLQALEGFMLSDEYESVVEICAWGVASPGATRHCVRGRGQARELSENSEIALVDGTGEPVATMVVRELYGYDKEREARMVYRTTDADHPGVAAVYSRATSCSVAR